MKGDLIMYEKIKPEDISEKHDEYKVNRKNQFEAETRSRLPEVVKSINNGLIMGNGYTRIRHYLIESFVSGPILKFVKNHFEPLSWVVLESNYDGYSFDFVVMDKEHYKRYKRNRRIGWAVAACFLIGFCIALYFAG